MAAQQIGRYHLDRQLSSGGAGSSYLAVDFDTQRNVLVRVLPQEAFLASTGHERLRAEIEAASKLDHLHIGTIYDFGFNKGDFYFVREYVPGLTLEKLPERGPLPSGTVVEFADQVAEALGIAHRAGLVHGALRPTNIVLTQDLMTKVVDFGMGSDLVMRPRRTRPDREHWLGALPYMAPEQVRYGKTDPLTDLYSLGAVLYKLSTGQTPYAGETVKAMERSVQQSKLRQAGELNPAIQPQLNDMIVRLMAREPAERPQSVGEVIDVLKSMPREALSAHTLGVGASARVAVDYLSKDLDIGDLETTDQPAASAAPGTRSRASRRVNTWFESEHDIPPLVARAEYTFKLNIGAPRQDAAGNSVDFVEPDFGGRQQLDLLVSLFSDDFSIAARHHPLVLPLRDDTAEIHTAVMPLHHGNCQLEIVLSLARELEVLQKLTVTVEAVEEAPVLAGA